MNMFKKNGGFTLVELIVVIAILAILAGVAVPAYTGYINEANNAAALNQLDAVKTAVMAAASMEGKTVDHITVAADGTITAYAGTTVVTGLSVSSFFTETTALTTALGNSNKFKDGATWESGNDWVGGVTAPTA